MADSPRAQHEGVGMSAAELLRRLALRRGLVSLRRPGAPEPLPCEAITATEAHLAVAPAGEVDASGYDVGARVSATLSAEGKVYGFDTAIVAIEPLPARARLVLRAPTRLQRVDRRQAFRVPIDLSMPVVLLLGWRGRQWSPRVVDLSVSGALVELPEPVVARLPDDERYRVELRYDGRVAEVDAVVQRKARGRLALHFPDTVRDLEPDPPRALARLVRAVERAWLQLRSSIANDPG